MFAGATLFLGSYRESMREPIDKSMHSNHANTLPGCRSKSGMSLCESKTSVHSKSKLMQLSPPKKNRTSTPPNHPFTTPPCMRHMRLPRISPLRRVTHSAPERDLIGSLGPAEEATVDLGFHLAGDRPRSGGVPKAGDRGGRAEQPVRYSILLYSRIVCW